MTHRLHRLSLLGVLALFTLVSCGETSSSSPLSSSSSSSSTGDSSGTSSSSSTSPSSSSSSSSTSSSSSSSSSSTNVQESFLEFQQYLNEEVLSQEIKEITFTESNTQDGYENRVRTTRYGVDEVYTTLADSETYLQYAAIRDDIFYTVNGGEDGTVTIGRQLISDTTSADTTTEEIARTTLDRYLDIADIQKTEIFDVFTEDVQATLFQQNGNTYTIAAYWETGSIYNYAYTLRLSIDENDHITALEGSVAFADGDHWDDVNKAPISEDDGYRVDIEVSEGDIIYGSYSADDPLLYDFSGAFVTSLEVNIYAEDLDGMGGGVTGEPNELKVGDYLTLEVVSYAPETAVDAHNGSFRITGSSDSSLVSVTTDGYGYYVPEQEEGFTEGTCEVYVGNVFNPRLGTAIVHVTGGGSSTQGAEPVVYGFDDQPGFEYIGSEELEGRFTIDVSAMEPTVFTAMTLVSGPFQIEGDEIQVDDPNLLGAMFQENPEGGMKIDLALMAWGGTTGTTKIHIPYTFNGIATTTATFEVQIVQTPKLMMIDEQEGYEELWEGECYGRFSLALADGEKGFSVQLAGSGPFQVTGDEIVSRDESIATAVFAEVDGAWQIVITPHQAGTTVIEVPSMMGIWPYEVVVA